MGHQPQRQCVGCGLRGPQAGFIRLGLDKDAVPPRVRLDTDKERRGRSAYLCRRRSCLDRAVHRRALQRAFRASVVLDVDEIAGVLETESGMKTEAKDTAGG